MPEHGAEGHPTCIVPRARPPVVAVEARPVDVRIPGIQRRQGLHRPLVLDVRAPHPGDVPGTHVGKDVMDVTPHLHELTRPVSIRVLAVGHLVDVHLPVEAEEEPVSPLLRPERPASDEGVVAPGDDLRQRVRRLVRRLLLLVGAPAEDREVAAGARLVHQVGAESAESAGTAALVPVLTPFEQRHALPGVRLEAVGARHVPGRIDQAVLSAGDVRAPVDSRCGARLPVTTRRRGTRLSNVAARRAEGGCTPYGEEDGDQAESMDHSVEA